MNFNGPEAELLPSVSEVIIPSSCIVYFPHQNRLFISGCISSRDTFFVHYVLWRIEAHVRV